MADAEKTDPDREPGRPAFPSLPVISPETPRRTQVEKYGGLYYVGIGGLVALVSIVAWFVWSFAATWPYWKAVYVLHDRTRPEAERVAAAYEIARDPQVAQRDRWHIALGKDLPPLARYVAAESLTAEAVTPDPAGYAASVARSKGWPTWLRLMLARPLAYASAFDVSLPHDTLEVLAENPDRATALLATFALAGGTEGDPAAREAVRKLAAADGPDRDLARFLATALDAPKIGDRLDALDAATIWLRTHHPGAAELWKGWEVKGGRLRPGSP